METLRLSVRPRCPGFAVFAVALCAGHPRAVQAHELTFHEFTYLGGEYGPAAGAWCSHGEFGFCGPEPVFLEMDSRRVARWVSACDIEYWVYLSDDDVDGSISASRGQVAYMSANSGDLKFVPYWGVVETVDTLGTVGANNSIAVASDGRPRIAYEDLTGGALKFAWRDGEEDWKREVVDSAGQGGQLPTLAIDTQGTAHVAYLRRVTGPGARDELVHAWRAAGGWNFETAGVFDQGAIHRPGSLALDAGDGPWIALGDGVTQALRLGRRTAGAWNWIVVDSTEAGADVSLRFDLHGSPCIAYYHQAAGDLKYAHQDSGSWTLQPVDTLGDVGKWASLYEGRWSSPSIFYFDDTQDALKWAHAGVLGSVSPGPARGPGRLTASPSPLGREGSVIELRGAAPLPAHAAVYDVAGRFVTSIPLRESGPDSWSGRWDGTHERGGAMPPGLYWIQVPLREGTARTSVVVVR